MVGMVDKLGEGVTHFKVGQRVADLTVIGAYSEYICLPESHLTLLPEGLDSAEAVILILSYVTAYQMLHRVAKMKQGQRILIHGAGGAGGTAMLQLGKLLDLEMYGTASKPKQHPVMVHCFDDSSVSFGQLKRRRMPGTALLRQMIMIRH